MWIKKYLILLIILSCAAILSAGDLPLATITSDVNTDFATYHPYAEACSPAIPAYTLSDDWYEVEYYLTLMASSAKPWTMTLDTLLKKNHFVVRPGSCKQMFGIYNESTKDEIPVFVTTDAVLHIYHVLFDNILADMEMRVFIPELTDLLQSLADQTESALSNAQSGKAVEALQSNLAFLYVPLSILDPALTVPDLVKAKVDSELVYIDLHDNYHYSPVLGPFNALDYSQFTVRGHYTKSDSLKAYFKSMMWLGFMHFTMEPQLFGDIAKQHTLQSILLTQMIYQLAERESAWSEIYLPTVFLVGKTDDPTISDYKAIGEQIYGSDYISLSPDDLAEETLLEQFMAEAQQLPLPKIPVYIKGTFIAYKGFRFMGQRFIPDSYMFAHLVFPDVSERLFPLGLDIMSILGSKRADTLLDSVYQQTVYPNYTNQIESFKEEFSSKSDAEWAQNLYWNWLYCLMPLLTEKGEGYPFFMQTLAWQDKELLTALASWAELRHDTILYAKQSATGEKSVPQQPSVPRSYVEPNPSLYARLASLARFTKEGLRNRSLLSDDFSERLDKLETLLIFLRDVSIKELENEALSSEDYANLLAFGGTMEELVSFYSDPENPWEPQADNMAIVADVHTDPNTAQCLEEGVGYPLEIYVIVNENGHVRLTRGAVFSYYEFQQPLANRLNDEQWREMLIGDVPPELPEWTGSFMGANPLFYGYGENIPDNRFHQEFIYTHVDPIHNQTKGFGLYQNYPNPFNPTTTIRYKLEKEERISLRIFDAMGRQVALLFEGIQTEGMHEILFDATGLPTGIYFYRLDTSALAKTGSILYLK